MSKEAVWVYWHEKDVVEAPVLQKFENREAAASWLNQRAPHIAVDLVIEGRELMAKPEQVVVQWALEDKEDRT